MPKRGGGARGASGYREVAISGSFAMNRFHFIVLPLPFAIFLSTILRLCIFLSFIFFFLGNFLIFQLRATVRMRNLGTHSFMA